MLAAPTAASPSASGFGEVGAEGEADAAVKPGAHPHPALHRFRQALDLVLVDAQLEAARVLDVRFGVAGAGRPGGLHRAVRQLGELLA
jgi:hypothetical protein